MALLTATNLHHAYGTQIVLDGVTLSIESGEKVGLVGRNGTGKSTLMQVCLGRLAPDRGDVQLQRGARVGYVSQDPELDPEDTVRDGAEAAFEELHRLHQEAHRVYDEMADAEGDELERLMKKQARLEAEIEAAGGYAIDHRIDATLHGVGFTDDQFTLPTTALSGGQKGRLGLARMLLEAPDLLLLDEPTNHLDLAGRQWLETFLADEYPGAVIVVSHDRWLLDRVVSRIIEIENGELRDSPGSFTKYMQLRRERQLTQARVYDKQLDHVRREKRFIQKYKTGQRAKQARGRETRLERFKSEMAERPAELEVMKLNLPKAPRSGDQVVDASGLTKRYDDLVLFEHLDVHLARGDRVGIIGPNGIGKTTLVRCLLGDLEPDEGEVRRGSRLSVGYYRQGHEHLDPTLTVWEYLQTVIVSIDGAARASEQQARDLAGAFLFSGGEQDKHVGDLSGGERSRMVLAGLVAGAHNMLVLDEPSNHLDIPSAERLEAALSRDGGFDGTLLLISHDRALLQATCNRLLVFEPGKPVRHFTGTYRDLLDRETRAAAAEAIVAEPALSKTGRQNQKQKQRSAGAAAATRTKTHDNPLARLSMEKLELRIVEIEQAIEDLDREMLDPAVYSDGERCKAIKDRRDQLQAELGPVEEEWGRRADED